MTEIFGVSAGPKPPALLLGGGIVAVSVARCLGQHGVPVWALGDARLDSAMHSRYCHRFVDLGSGEGVQERWLGWLSDHAPRGAVLLPCSDDALEMICRNRSALEAHGLRPIEANDEVALAMLDKLETYRRAMQLGIEVPRHFRLGGEEADVPALLAASGVEFPCAIKPLHSHVFRRHFREKVLLAQNQAELQAAARTVSRHALEVMVTEVIPGPEDSYLAFHGFFDQHGTPLSALTKRKIGQYPVGFGMGTYHVSEWNAEVAEQGLRFCQGVGIRGVGNPEFKRDARDGRLKLIECNHRFSMVNELLRRAGLNTPLLAYRRLVGQSVVPRLRFRRGVRLWFPVADARAFGELRARRETGLPLWLISLAHRQHLATFDWRDPAPALHEWRARLLPAR